MYIIYSSGDGKSIRNVTTTRQFKIPLEASGKGGIVEVAKS